MLFTEVPFVDRFERVYDAGLGAVEFWWPAGEDLEAVAARIRDIGLEVALFNFDAGDMPAGDRGLLADHDRIEQFRAHVPVALDLAERLECPRLNALVGLELPGRSREAQVDLVRENLRFAANLAASRGIEVMVEAVNTFENGPYLVSSTADAVALIDSTASPNVSLQYDVYHMVTMGENPAAMLERHIDRIGHIQVADVPGRGQPGSGEVDYPALLALLERLDYRGYVGLEYRPSGCDSRESLRQTMLAADHMSGVPRGGRR
jgi:hydroxypyruvate isomerase